VADGRRRTPDGASRGKSQGGRGASTRGGRGQGQDRLAEGGGQGDSGEFVDVVDMKLNDVVEKIRGKKGTTVRLVVLPEGGGDPKTIKIVRDQIDLKDQEASGTIIEEGRKAGRWVSETFKDATADVNIVELQGTVGSAPANDRKAGFEEVIAANPHLKIIRSQSGDFTRAKGKETMEAILKSESRKIHVLYAHNDDMAIGAIQAIDEAGLRPGKEILIVSIDAVKGAFEAMIAGKLNATIECNPLLGPQLMTSVAEVVAGRPIPKRIVVEETMFTMDTAKQFIQTRKY